MIKTRHADEIRTKKIAQYGSNGTEPEFADSAICREGKKSPPGKNIPSGELSKGDRRSLLSLLRCGVDVEAKDDAIADQVVRFAGVNDAEILAVDGEFRFHGD